MSNSSSRRRRALVLIAIGACLAGLLAVSLARAAYDVSPPCCNLAVTVPAGHAVHDGDVVRIEFVVTEKGADGSPSTTISVRPTWPVTTQTETVPELAYQATWSHTFTFDAPPGDAHGGILGSVKSPSPADDPPRDNFIRVGVVEAPTPKPGPADFALVAASGRSMSSATATRATVRLRVSNNGKTAAAPTVIVTAPWGGKKKVSGAELAAGETRPVEAPLAVPDAERGKEAVFKATVDPAPGETPSDDNRATVKLDIPKTGGPGPGERRPDLVAAILKTPAQSKADVVAVPVRVRNDGELAVERLVIVVEGSWGVPPKRVAAGRLAPSHDTTKTVHLKVPEDAQGHKQTITATAEPIPGDANEADNTATRALTLISATGRLDTTGGGGGGGGIPAGMLAAALAIAALLALAGALLARRWLRRRAPHRLAPQPDRPQPDRPQPPAIVPERPVRTGFATLDDPGGELAAGAALVPGETCVFWVEVGEPGSGPAYATNTAGLEVALFALSPGKIIAAGADRGHVVIGEQGSARVERQPGAAPAQADPELAGRRLFFGVRPDGEAIALRCSIYAHNVLVWSQLIRAPVARPGGRRADIDFGIMPRLDPARLRRIAPHRLSVLLNSDGAGSHALTFLGEQDFKSGASFDAAELQDSLDRLRGGLRLASWGTEEEWAPGNAYRHETPDPGRSRQDLTRMAIRGHRFYTQLATRFAEEVDAYQLQDLMRRPGLIQIATKESPRHQLPAALLYDHPLDTTSPRLEDYRLCPAFTDACDRAEPLEASPCMRGECPSYGDLQTICPSGFWGYRHELGMPLSARGGDDSATEIAYGAAPELLIAVATDPQLELRETHERALHELPFGSRWRRAVTRADTLEQLGAGASHLVYFYCHGGSNGSVPFLHVGDPSEPPLTADLLFAHRIRWEAPRPLVFLNGCRTTAVRPSAALEFVSVWLRIAQAAGVIGSDITVFEPFASAFAEQCLARFLGGEPLGAAVRGARLELLKQHNPLGLAYVPFALAGLRLASQSVA